MPSAHVTLQLHRSSMSILIIYFSIQQKIKKAMNNGTKSEKQTSLQKVSCKSWLFLHHSRAHTGSPLPTSIPSTVFFSLPFLLRL